MFGLNMPRLRPPAFPTSQFVIQVCIYYQCAVSRRPLTGVAASAWRRAAG